MPFSGSYETGGGLLRAPRLFSAGVTPRRSGKWLALAAAVVVAGCAGLGIWQLRRLADRREANRVLLERRALPVVALDAAPAPTGGRADSLAYRRARASGEYDTANEVLLRARSLDGRAGNHVLTPLRLPSGRAIVVDRGWVPLAANRPPVAEAPPPKGRVTVTGILAPSEPKPRIFGPRDPPSGRLSTIGRIDLDRLARQIPYPVEPLYLALEEQQPPQPGSLPAVAGLPPPGEGPHLAYAVQWFVFGAIAGATAILLLRAERRYPMGSAVAR